MVSEGEENAQSQREEGEGQLSIDELQQMGLNAAVYCFNFLGVMEMCSQFFRVLLGH